MYGILTIGINWLPGLVAATHVFSMYRRTLPVKKTALYACNFIKYFLPPEKMVH